MQQKPIKSGTLLRIVLLSAVAMLVQGYHPGAEDDAVYLAAIHYDLNPRLFPYDSQFFRMQLQASIYDRLMAASIRVLHLPVNFTMLLWQFGAICLVLYAGLRLARRLFETAAAQWAGVSLLATFFALPVAGTALFVVDPQLHPRTLATALVLFGAEASLVGRGGVCVLLLVLAGAFHPIMAAFGVSFCAFLWLQQKFTPVATAPVLAAVIIQPPAQPRFLGWLLDQPTSAWRQAMSSRHYIFLSRWDWYEWLGAVAPPLLLAWCWRWAKKVGRRNLAIVSAGLVAYSAFQLAFALIVSLVPALVRMLPLQPMRFLHLVYLIGILIAGGILGEFVLKDRAWRWLACFLPLAMLMFVVQKNLYPATPQLELPGISDNVHSSNQWLQAFAWIKKNTPIEAYFALDPNYMALPGEDYHGFRALAERSVLADSIKDSAVAMQVPRLAPLWLEQTKAAQGFQSFTRADFIRLHRQFGVAWTVLPAGRDLNFDCPYKNASVQVCRIPPG